MLFTATGSLVCQSGVWKLQSVSSSIQSWSCSNFQISYTGGGAFCVEISSGRLYVKYQDSSSSSFTYYPSNWPIQFSTKEEIAYCAGIEYSGTGGAPFFQCFNPVSKRYCTTSHQAYLGGFSDWSCSIR